MSSRDRSSEQARARHRDYQREWRRRHRERINEERRKRHATDPEFRAFLVATATRGTQVRYQRLRQELDDFKRVRGCALCDESEPCALVFHHPDPSTKAFSIGPGLMLRLSVSKRAQVWREVEKCVVLCVNCHRKVHAGLAQLD